MTAVVPGASPAARLPVREAAVDLAVDPRVDDPGSFRIAFVILLDGDLVMSPEHLGVASITAVLRTAGFDVRIFEVARGNEVVAIRELAQWRPRITGFTLMSLNVSSCVEFCALLDGALSETLVVCGGPAGTYAGGEVLAINPFVNAVVVGEGEATFLEVAQRAFLGSGLDGCAGVTYRAPDGAICQNPSRPLLHDLDALPFPARDQFEAHGRNLEYLRVSTSRGCVARCTFCSAPNVGNAVQFGKAWRGRSVDSVLNELEYLVRTYDFHTYDFIDSTFEDPDGGTIGKARVRALAEGILDRQLEIYFNCCMRAENWSDDDHELLDLLVRSGLEKVNVGIEAGNERDLRLWDKLATVEDNIRIIRLLREHGVYLAMGFIQFHPYSTVETLKENAEFLRRHGGHNLRRLTERLEVYPGTRIVERIESDGLLAEDFRSTLNPYAYRYADERVGRLAVHFASLYNNEDYHEKGVVTEQSSVFAFETFNVVVQTFVSRTSRRSRNVPGAREVLEAFNGPLHEIRQGMAEFNYEFFMQNLEDVLDDRLDDTKRRSQLETIERYFAERMREIRSHQLLAGRRLQRLGVDLARVRSGPVRARAAGAPRTYTGGAPCW